MRFVEYKIDGIKQLVILMEGDCVFCDVGTESLFLTWMNSRLQCVCVRMACADCAKAKPNASKRKWFYVLIFILSLF
jgi:hypothetical protein